MDAIIGLFYWVAGAVGAVFLVVLACVMLFSLAKGAVDILAWFIDPM